MTKVKPRIKKSRGKLIHLGVVNPSLPRAVRPNGHCPSELSLKSFY